MKTMLSVVFLGATIAAAAPERKPRQVVSDSKFQSVETATATLPPALRDALLYQDEFSRGTGTLPETLSIRSIDLNGDGSLDYIVRSRQSYSGGPAHVILERRKTGYESIGYFQGGILYLAARVNGYYQICARVRQGAYVLRFTDGEYRPVR